MAEMEKRPWRFTIEFDEEKAKRNGYNVDDLYDCVGEYAEQMGNVRIGLGTWQAKNREVQFGAQCPVCATLSKQPWVMQNIKSWRTYALAAGAVLDYFNDFMDGLCTGFYTDADGFWDYGIDLSMKSFMQAKLLRAMLRFQP